MHKKTPINIQSIGITAVALRNDPAMLPILTPSNIPIIPPNKHNVVASTIN